MKSKPKRVLVAPLEWGLGHATRCVPLIRELIRQGAEVVLAADGGAYRFLEKEFPGMTLVRFPGYGITYPRGSWLFFHLALRSPMIAMRVKRERKFIRKLVHDYAIDIIISDNRFACRTPKTHNVYITHQLNVKAPFSGMATRMHHRYYDKFDEVWVPDMEGKKNLSGELGHIDYKDHFVRYLGPLTRFEIAHPIVTDQYKWWLVVLLSGPEPQRSIFEKIVLEELAKFTEDALIVRGLPADSEIPHHALQHVKMVNHLEDHELKDAVLHSLHVLCRPGYSTLCDLSALGISPIVVPTPGQMEQEYLAEFHAQNRHVVSCSQKDFNLGEAIREHSQLRPFGIFPMHQVLEDRVKKLLGKIS